MKRGSKIDMSNSGGGGENSGGKRGDGKKK